MTWVLVRPDYDHSTVVLVCPTEVDAATIVHTIERDSDLRLDIFEVPLMNSQAFLERWAQLRTTLPFGTSGTTLPFGTSGQDAFDMAIAKPPPERTPNATDPDPRR